MTHPYIKEYFEKGVGSHHKQGYVLDKNREAVERRRLAILKKYLCRQKNINILDIGCAKGFFLKFCDELGWQTFGVDISSYTLGEAPKYTKAKLFQLDLAKDQLLFPDNFFHAITSFDLIEHLKDDTLFLKEIKRTLRSDGVALIATPDGKSRFDINPHHINLYKKEELISRLKKFDFKIIDMRPKRGYTIRIIPLRRFRLLNWLNQRICDLLGLYLKGVMVIMKK